MKIRLLIAVLFLVCGSAEVQAQTENSTRNSDGRLNDYLRCQFKTAEEQAFRQDSSLDAAKQAVRAKASSPEFKNRIASDQFAALMQSVERDLKMVPGLRFAILPSTIPLHLPN